MPEWKQLIIQPAGALRPNLIRNAGIVFFTVVMLGLVLSTMWTSSTDDTGEVLAGTEPNLTGPGQVAQLTTRLTDLQDEQQRAQARAAAEAQREADVPPWERTVPGVTGPAIADSADAVTLTTPTDPRGWERVYEGSVVSAVLVTQLSGDFAGPVEAHVSIPFYSSDRQRILIPRGSRLLGTVQPVRDRDQSRLAVGFHRLILPDGRWVNLAFHGLNGIGEGALRDQVNRHYVSMFAAAGAVGVIAGLTLQGANPYGGGQQGFQSGVSQGLGQGASQMLDRFLNRLPSLTIRAGHRLRVWLTGDVLMPRPAAHPERIFR